MNIWTYIMITISKIEIYIYNTSFWYHIYYKHTSEHKKDLQDTYDRVINEKMRIIGK